MKDKNKLKTSSFWIGVAIVVLTHVYMLFAGLTPGQVIPHSIFNLVAVALIVYGWFG
ncbi:hypothetical protein HOI26_02350 [Candidatus Woesearchaeota archaeon]|jgi:hypothetical protein|nr:hypothetical protein [Candidatus Woesearchaeota archaeon]MBT5739919.1 hypothetical protein [Candidatus Woesearchaeota archaeon]